MLCQHLLQKQSLLAALMVPVTVRMSVLPRIRLRKPYSHSDAPLQNGEEEALPLPPRFTLPYYVTLVRLVPGRLLQPLEEFSIGWTIDLEQAKGAFFGAEKRVVNRHKRAGHFAFKFSDGRFTRPHQGALDMFKRRF